MSEVRIPEVERVIRKYGGEPFHDQVTIETVEGGRYNGFDCITFEFLGGGILRIDDALAKKIYALVGDSVEGE